MPGLNRKGPNGEGAMTGRRMGRCNPENRDKTVEEIAQNREVATEKGRGFGMGLGHRHGAGQGRGLGQGRGRAMHFRGQA
jgi:hypothetical protein